jgi:hypothetical protein
VSKDGKTPYSSSIIDVAIVNDISPNGFEVILDDYQKGPLKGSSPAPNTQVNAIGISLQGSGKMIPIMLFQDLQNILHKMLFMNYWLRVM